MQYGDPDCICLDEFSGTIQPVCVSGPRDSITQVIYLVTLSHKLVKHVTTLCWLNYLPDFEFLPVHVAVKGRIFKLMCLFEGGKR